jgi:hypothetical protein
MMRLHGRDLYNMFALYGAELQGDIYDLTDQHLMGNDLRPSSSGKMVLVPAMAPRNAKRMRYAWDYFTFIFMSHKIQNIRRRHTIPTAKHPPILLYLRGADYELAITNEGAAISHSTTDDFYFGADYLRPLRHRFNIVKALSPSDLSWAMKDIGNFLGEHGSNLQSVAEFARIREGGVFMNPANWKARLAELLPSAALFLVYVSNQSNGLAYELESLLAAKAQDQAILVLDERRFGSREPFFALQERLTNSGDHLYLSVDRNACTVDDPDRFERLVACFPHRIPLGADSAQVLREIEALIPLAQRASVAPPLEFPFEFAPSLAPTDAEQVETIRRDVRQFIEQSLSAETVSNWPVLLLYFELDIFFGLAFGDTLSAAASAARYAAVADFTRGLIRRNAPERVADLDAGLKLCGDIGMNIALDASAMGEWNDYSDRRRLAKEQVEATARQVTDLMERSIAAADAVLLREPKPEPAPKDPSLYSDLIQRMLDSHLALNREEK